MVLIGLIIFCSLVSCIDEKKQVEIVTKAFQEELYIQDALNQLVEVNDFSNFLIRNHKELIYFNQHEDFKTYEISEGRFTKYQRIGDCAGYPIRNKKFNNEYVPKELQDSFYYFINKMNPDIVKGIRVCEIGFDKKEPSIYVNLGVFNEMDYTIYHSFKKNLRFNTYLKLESIEGELLRDTLLENEFRYTIRLIPEIGF